MGSEEEQEGFDPLITTKSSQMLLHHLAGTTSPKPHSRAVIKCGIGVRRLNLSHCIHMSLLSLSPPVIEDLILNPA